MAVTLSPFIEVVEVYGTDERLRGATAEMAGFSIDPNSLKELDLGLRKAFEDGFNVIVYDMFIYGFSVPDVNTRARAMVRARNPFTPSLLKITETRKIEDRFYNKYSVKVAVRK